MNESDFSEKSRQKFGSHSSYLKTKNNMNGNATSQDEDEDALKSNCDIVENKPKVRMKKKL